MKFERPQILVSKNRHYSIYYIITSIEDLEKICFKFLKQNFENEVYIQYKDLTDSFDEFFHNETSLELKDIENLQEFAKIEYYNAFYTSEELIKRVKKTYKDKLLYNKIVSLIPLIIESEDYKKAFEAYDFFFEQGYSQHHYELITPEEIE